MPSLPGAPVRAALLALALLAAPAHAADTDTDVVDTDVVDTDTDVAAELAPPDAPIVRAPPPPATYEGPPLVVGVKPTAPFAFEDEDGRWRGVSVELWTAVAEDAGIPWELREVDDLGALLDALEVGEIDVAVGALTVTAAREARLDFSHPFHDTGYGIATRRQAPGLSWLTSLLSPTFWRVVAGLTLLLLVVGALVWLAERKRNPEEFGGSVVEGLGHGLWWSAVTMTTVGYGDKSPRTLLGRILALVWMFASIIVISSFTAAIASSLTVTRLDLGITGPDDLPGATVGSVRDSTSVAWLRDNHLSVRRYDTVSDALDALAAGDLDAVVYDASILRYLVRTRGDRSLKVVPETFGRQSYALGLRDGAPYREVVNRVLLDRLEGRWWEDLLFRYTGE